MRRFHGETAAAFGDEPDRDVEAQFGASPLAALVAAAKTASVKASGASQPPTLRVVAPPAPSSTAKPRAAAKATVSVAAPKPAAKASVSVAAPKPSSKAPRVAAPARPAPASAYAANANQANFIDGGGTPIALPVVNVPAGTVTMTQAQRDANARALLKQKTLATAVRNVPALNAKRTQTFEAARDGGVLDGIKQPWERAGVDVGQIVMGAKVLAVGATVIATGGAVAGAIGVTAGGASLATAAAADRLVAAVEKGGELGKQAKGVIADVKAAAAKGDKAAKDALAVVNAVADGRVAAGVRAGVEQTLTAAGKDAANAVAGIALGLSGSGSLSTAGVAANLAAAAGNAPAGGGFVNLRPASSPQVVSSQTRPKQLSQFDFGEETPRWLVTPEGRIVDLKRAPSKATGKGFIVTAEGDVRRQ
jgi:hypothetical protein